MQNTTNYNLNKPDSTDFAKIEALNDNADIIDRLIKELETAKANNTDLMSLTNTVSTHLNQRNPHGTTKSDVGLGSVQNYAIATQAQAEAGTADNLYMTPLRAKQAIDKTATSWQKFKITKDNGDTKRLSDLSTPVTAIKDLPAGNYYLTVAELNTMTDRIAIGSGKLINVTQNGVVKVITMSSNTTNYPVKFHRLVNDSGDTGWLNDDAFFTGSGSPEGVVTAAVGSIYVNADGGDSSTLYVKTSGGDKTGWLPIVNKSGIDSSGQNVNGTWTKFDDGTLICSHKVTLTNIALEAYGPLYRSTTVQTWTYPATFISEAQGFVDGDASASFTYKQNAYAGSLTYRPTYITATTIPTTTVSLLAIGRWK